MATTPVLCSALLIPLLISFVPSTALADSARPANESRQVTPENYIRAETDRMFAGINQRAGGINKLWKVRRPAALDQQPVIRMNRDTLYIGAIVDTEGGASFTLPKMPDDRYASVMVVDNDHYTSQVIYEPGTHEIAQDTKYVLVAARFQIKNPQDETEIQLLNQLQDQFTITAKSADPLPAFSWDSTSLQKLHNRYESEFQQLGQYAADWMGARGKVNEKTRHLAAAGAWGLLPEKDAIYINYAEHHDHKVCHKATYRQPENNAFWSITVYNAKGYMESDNNIVNSSTAVLNDDGSFTVYYGSEKACGQVDNRLDTGPDWNFLMRVYRPGQSVLDRSYTLPKAEPVPSASGEEFAHPNDFGVNTTAYRVSESNVYIQKHLKKAPVNTFAHQRNIVRVDTQQVIRENQDTLYSSAVVDVSKGATITVPDYDAYSIIQVIDMQNYSIGTIYPGESLTINKNDLSYGNYVYLNARTQPTSDDAAGLDAAHRQQDALQIEANSANPYATPDIVIPDDKLLEIRTALIKDVAQGKIKNYTTLMGTRDFVDPQGHLYATAYGWGGLPIEDAGYIVIPVKAEPGVCSQLALDPPPLNYAKGGFWSVTTYNTQGWLARDKAAISNREAKVGTDGNITLRFNCSGAENNLDTVEPFAALLRLYVPESAEQLAEYLSQARQQYVITQD
jgi:hypothetical protein